MRSTLIGSALVICAFSSVFSRAQPGKVLPTASVVKAAPQNLLLPDDGLSVIAAALDARNRFSDKADCSHLVHDIYERAGFTYAYVPSSDLYAGIGEFRRVTHPQPGDLIVWPGHVGIVVSPSKHSFYSSLRSGLGVEPYDSDYWKQRGRPRFLRYVKDGAQPSETKTPALKSTSLETTETEAAPATSPEPAVVEFPRTLTVDAAHPTAQDVSEAVMSALSQTADRLKGRNIFGTAQTITVLNRITVERVKIKGVTGWADIQVAQSAQLTGAQSNVKKRQEKQRWTMRRRDEQSWSLVLPQGIVFLNQEDAVRLLAQQLAAMTAEDASSDVRDKAKLAGILGSLLQIKN